MSLHIAFLRGINLGRRRVKMADLRRHFEALKFKRVGTFIASGNVVFDAAARDPAKLETRIEKHLRDALGFDVDTFVRTSGELGAVAGERPFASADMEAPDHSIHVTFLRAEPDAETRKGFAALRTDMDEFRVIGRELYWLCRGKLTQSSVAAPVLTRVFRTVPGTMRNLKTVRKLAELYPPAADR